MAKGGAAALRRKQQLKELHAKRNATQAATRETRAARMASEINLLISAADQASNVLQLQAALGNFNGLEGGWATLVRDLSSSPRALQNAVVQLGACRARVHQRLLTDAASAVSREVDEGLADVESVAAVLLREVLAQFKVLEDNRSLRGLAAQGFINLDPEDQSAKAADARLEKELQARAAAAPGAPA